MAHTFSVLHSLPAIREVPNPALAKFWNGIEALALGAEEVQPVIDKTKPDPELFERLSSDLKSISYG